MSDPKASLLEFLHRLETEPQGVDLSDYSDEFAKGFLAGQRHIVEEIIEGRVEIPTPESPSLLETRRWDVASVEWHRVVTLLDQGWEPFAVVQREPNSEYRKTEATVYLRRERKAEDA